MTTGEMLTAWREATRAAEIAEQLATLAAEAAQSADVNAETAEQVAVLAEQTASLAAAAAERARNAADDARRIVAARQGTLHDADDIRANTRATEDGARVAYHQAEDEARSKRR